MRTVLIVLALLLSTFNTTPASAQNRPWSLVCFEQEGLQNVLARVVNIQQFLQNSLGQTADINFIRRQGCDYAQIPSGSTARSAGVYQSEQFIFPLFRATFSTTGQQMYAADGIFRREEWRVTQQCTRGAYAAAGELCIVPANCLVLDGFFNFRQSIGLGLPSYVVAPRGCQQYIIQ